MTAEECRENIVKVMKELMQFSIPKHDCGDGGRGGCCICEGGVVVFCEDSVFVGGNVFRVDSIVGGGGVVG